MKCRTTGTKQCAGDQLRWMECNMMGKCLATPTPERAANPTPEALKIATETVTGWYDSGYYQELSLDVAHALDAFAQAAVEKERERCAKHSLKYTTDTNQFVCEIADKITQRILRGDQS